MKTVNIKGKSYVMVHERIKAFREKFPSCSLVSEITHMLDGQVVVKASILDGEGRVLATGHAHEREGSTQINKTSYIENCETSAWGRALANLGIGIDASMASAEEVAQAIKQQTDITPHGDDTSKTYIDRIRGELDMCETAEEVDRVWKSCEEQRDYIQKNSYRLYMSEVYKYAKELKGKL